MTETLTIYYERKLSDGEYGSEGLAMGVTVECQDGATLLDDGTTRDLYMRLRRNVLGHLSLSQAPRVARLAANELGEQEPIRLHPTLDDDDDEPPF